MDDLAEGQDVVIVPAGFLALLPLEVVTSKDLASDERDDLARRPYLVIRSSLGYVDSAWFLVSRARRDISAKTWKREALLIGDPLYNNERQRSGDMERGGIGLGDWERLDKARDEIITIAKSLLDDNERNRALE